MDTLLTVAKIMCPYATSCKLGSPIPTMPCSEPSFIDTHFNKTLYRVQQVV